MSNWYFEFKQAEFNWGQFSKTLAPFVVVSILITYFGMRPQEAKEMAQNRPAEVDALLQQVPAEAIQQAQQQSQTTTQQEVTSSRIGIEDMRDIISKNEGFREYSYQDTTGNTTVGFGFNLERPDAKKLIEGLGYDFNKVYQGSQPVSKEASARLRDYAIEEAIGIADSFSGGLENHPREAQIVITDMAYNLGPNRLNQFVKMKQAIQQKNYAAAAKEMVDSKWYGQVKGRAKELVQMMKSIQ